ncbi:putative DNA-binding transcriptional regulator AlpA [Luteibacter sp. Sphag1AF]|nr:putative DNA-binding transcriptional regulator AlpA [Luteibacter sp. Sphag1AF]
MSAANDDSMWNAEAVCHFMGDISRRHFLERIACKPGFPTPFVLSRKVKLWYPSEIREWVKRNRINQAA